jgi:subtilisin family serine protease
MAVFRLPPVAVGAKNIDPRVSKEWHHDIMQFKKVREKVKDIEGKVCIIDDTALTSNLTLDKSVEQIWDFTGENGESGPHGHHVGGIIACSRLGYFPKTRIMFGKVLSAFTGVGFGVNIASAIEQAYNSGYNVINASLGSDQQDPKMKKAVIDFCKKGGIFVCAAGNDGKETDYPAGWAKEIKGVISVGAFEKFGDNYRVATYSSRGVVNFVFPGTNILSTYPGDLYREMSGTSMATPFLSGLVATIRAIVPHITFDQFMNLAETHCTPIEGDPHKEGLGVIKVLDLLDTLDNITLEKITHRKKSCVSIKNIIKRIIN